VVILQALLGQIDPQLVPSCHDAPEMPHRGAKDDVGRRREAFARESCAIKISRAMAIQPRPVALRVALPAVAVFRILADVLDGDDMLVGGGVEHDDALGRAAGDADVLDRAADQLALVGHQHDLIAILDRE
jgi:hypothetical protein